MIFQNSNSFLLINQSSLIKNGGYLGGAIYLQHTAGEVFIKNCIFNQNLVKMVILPGNIFGNDSTGGGIAWNCYSTSIIRSYLNDFFKNTAKNGVVGGISGIFIDVNSTFEGMK